MIFLIIAFPLNIKFSKMRSFFENLIKLFLMDCFRIKSRLEFSSRLLILKLQF